MDNLFFKPTPLYKEYMILDLIDKDSDVTQRQLSESIGASVSMINTYIEEYEVKGYLKRTYITNKNIEYKITKYGKERKKLLNIGFLKSAHSIYTFAKENILLFLNQIIDKGFKNIYLYGAGEVAEIMLNVLDEYKAIPLSVLGLVDDEITKQGKRLINTPIVSIDKLVNTAFDGVLISSFTHRNEIYNKLVNKGYNKEKIINFFDIE